MKSSFPLILLSFLFLHLFSCHDQRIQKSRCSETTLLFEDTGTDDWQNKWMLDGTWATVLNTDEGMELIAGPEAGNDSCHAVLWTKQSFQGDICIEYDYTRTDTVTRYVNILYFLAAGEGGSDYPEDIALWNDKRVVSHMRTYFNHMNTYHISYAAFPGDNDYIRLRRYDPYKEGLTGTNVAGDHFGTGLFKTNVTYHIKVFNYKNSIEMHIQDNRNESEHLICKWDVSAFPSCESGRIGFRHMFTRSARYKNIKVWKQD